MIGKIIGAALGAKAAEHTRGVGGAGGALLGVGAAALLRRMSLPAMLALAAGGYAYKRYSDKRTGREQGTGGSKRPKVRPSAT
jgi:hypothetical protein